MAPKDPVAYRALSVFYETTGQRDKAIVELKTLETAQFRDLVVKQRLVENLLSAGRLDEAEATNRAIKKAAAQSAHPYYTDGRIYMARKQFEAAIAPLNQAISIERQPDYYYSLGMAQASLGLLKQARESFQRAISLDPQRVDAILALAGLALGSGNQSFALQTTNQVLTRYPDSSEAKIVRAQALVVLGNLILRSDRAGSRAFGVS